MDLNSDSRLAQCHQWLTEHFQLSQLKLTVVSGDASFRRYFRFEQPLTQGSRTLIAVDAPPDKEDSTPFVELSRIYQKQGLIVPEVIAADLSQGFMCLSDLGDRLLLSELTPQNVDHYYQQALALIPQIAAVKQSQSAPLPAYDDTRLMTEMTLLTDWLLPHHLDLSLNASQHQIIKDAFAILLDNALAQPQVGVHRDYHSRNLMLTPDNQLAVIDFQDALIGPVTYDAVSLLRDCYIRWPQALIYRHLLDFKQLIGQTVPGVNEVSDEIFIRWFDLMGMQRHIKVCGIFSRLCYRDGKTAYLDDLPMTLDYLIEVGRKYPEFTAFVTLLDEQVRPLLLQKAG